jgi:hypothetical protein
LSFTALKSRNVVLFLDAGNRGSPAGRFDQLRHDIFLQFGDVVSPTADLLCGRDLVAGSLRLLLGDFGQREGLVLLQLAEGSSMVGDGEASPPAAWVRTRRFTPDLI